jgi:histidine triad (HIT) family protein
MPSCVFCQIIKKEIPANIVCEDARFLVFMDIHPVNLGHVLIVPKVHYSNLYEMPDESLSSLGPMIKKIAVAVKEGVSADGINIGMNNGQPAGQLIGHAHVHIIPRFENDGHRHWKGKKPYSVDEISSAGRKIKDCVQNDLTP